MISSKLLIAGAVAAAAVSGVTSGTANAASYICAAGDTCDFDGSSGGVGGVRVGAFATTTDTFQLLFSSTGYFTINIANSKLSLLSASFAGTPFTPVSGLDQRFYISTPASYTLSLTSYNPTSKSAAYSINFDFGIPEPAVWGMMIGGFGIAGASLRARRRTVQFA